MLEIKELTKYYGKVKGVEKLNLKINKGEIFGFIGPNGAGKSTTIRCIMNIINKTSGEIYIDGELATKDNIKIKENIGYLPSEISLYEDLTVKQMLEYSNSFYKKDYSKNIEYLVSRLELDTKKKIDELSLGNQKKLGVVLAMLHEPDLLILDEATSGLDPLMQKVFYELLLQQKEKGVTIVFSSHILGEVKKICDRVGIIKDGELIKVEETETLLKSDFGIVTLVSKDIDKIIKEPNITIISQEKDTIKFIYKESINELIKLLFKVNIEKLLIEEPSIEDVFMHYYK